jgi:hypothetical protein
VVPANLPALYWRPQRSNADGPAPDDPARVVLVSADAPDEAIPLAATELANGDFLLVPEQQLVAGTRYELRDENPCEGSLEVAPAVTFTAGPEAPLPSTLGALVTAEDGIGSLTVATSSGSCEAPIDADRVDVAVELSPEAAPWRDALHFETLVDGATWGFRSSVTQLLAPGSSPVGRGADLLFHGCVLGADAAPLEAGLPSGEHTVAMRATLPGADLVLEVGSATIDLDCGGSSGAPPGGDEHDGGCTAGAGSSAASLAGLALVGAALARRRRRRG